MAALLNEGVTYHPKVTVTNTSSKLGTPVAAVLNLQVSCELGGVSILHNVGDYSFGATETRELLFDLPIPIGSGGQTGEIVAVARDPNGNPLATGSLDVVIAEAVAEFIYVSAIRQTTYEENPGLPWVKKCLKAEIDVKNMSSIARTCFIQAQLACFEGGWVWSNFGTRSAGSLKSAVIQPGQTVTFFDTVLNSSAYGYTCKIRFTGDPGTTLEVSMI